MTRSTHLLAIILLISKAIADNCKPMKYGNDNENYFMNVLENSVSVTCKNNSAWKNLLQSKIKLNCHSKEITIFDCDFSSQKFRISDVTKKFNLTSYDILFSGSKEIKKEHLADLSIKELVFENSRFNVSSGFLYNFDIRNLTIKNIPKFFESIPDGFFEKSENLTILKITGTHLNRLRKNDFRQLKKLEKLILLKNRIEEIESETFDELTSLQALNISVNKLKSLPSNLFLYNQNLKKVSISNNAKLGALPEGFFKNLRHLTTIDIRSCNLSNLPQDLFLGAHSIRNFFIRNNKLVELPAKLFESSSSIEIIDLSENNLEVLPEIVFGNNINIDKLIILKNNLHILPEKLFRGHVYINELDLSENKLSELPEDLFKNVTIKKLKLDNNRLTKFSSALKINSLKKLYIRYNGLLHIDDNFCTATTSLTDIDLSFNQLTLINNSLVKEKNEKSFELSKCNRVENFILKNNNIFELPYWKFQTANKTFDFEYNNITEISLNTFFHYRKSKIILKNNKISTINWNEVKEADGKNIYEHSNISNSIELDGNPINCDCKIEDFIYFTKKNGSFKKIGSKNEIHYSNLKCATPSEFKGKYVNSISVEKLSCQIECNGICTCTDYSAQKLLSLDCSNKSLTTITDILSPNFTYPRDRNISLNLRANKFEVTPLLNESFLLNVTHLDLSDNNISDVRKNVFTKNLKELRLHNNKISRLGADIVYHLEQSSLTKLTLQNNLWKCDCDALALIHFVRKDYSKLLDYDGIKCHDTNQLFKNISDEDICSYWLLMSIILLVSIFGSIIGFLAAYYYKYQKQIKIWLYSKQWCLWFITENELDKNKEYDAFISFSHKDEDFVNEEIVKNLEKGPRPYKLCLHYRDWLAGEWIPDQITHSVVESRRTVIVLTSNFLESIWGRMEFRVAHNQAIKECRSRVIIIIYGEIGNVDDFDTELKTYLNMNTYIKWGDPWFWDKLKYALPHKHERSRWRKRHNSLIENEMERLPLDISKLNSAEAESKADGSPAGPNTNNSNQENQGLLA